MKNMLKILLCSLLLSSLLISTAFPALADSTKWSTLSTESETIYVNAERKNAYINISVKKQAHWITGQYPMSKIGVRFTIEAGPEDSKRVGTSVTVKTGSYWLFPSAGERGGQLKLDKPGEYTIMVSYRTGIDRYEAGDPGVAWRVEKSKHCKITT